MLFVSHSIDQVKAICDTAILLDHGNIIAQGDVDTVSNIYDEMTRDVRDSKAKAMKEEKEILKKLLRQSLKRKIPKPKSLQRRPRLNNLAWSDYEIT